MAEPGTRGAQRGLLLGLGAFFALIVAPLLPLLSVLFTFVALASLALLSGDARRRGPQARRTALAGLVVLALGLLLALAANLVLASSLEAGRFAAWRAALWLYLPAETAVAAGFYLGALHLASDRSRMLLGLALGAAVATSAVATWQSQGAAEALAAAGEAQGAPPGSEEYRAWARAALQDFSEATSAANQGKSIGFIVFAWAYATVLGRLRAPPKPDDPWALPP